MAKILIVGCGAIGVALAEELANAGHQVTGIKRHPTQTTISHFKYFCADITLAKDLENLDSDYEYVYFIVSADRRDEVSYRAIYETGMNNLLHILPQAKWFFVSSTSVYGQNKGEWVDENSPALGSTPESRYILAAERQLILLNSTNVIIRFSGIYGAGREYLLKTASQSPTIQQDPPYYTNRIHQHDCLRILVFLLDQSLSGMHLASCYLASDDNPATLWDVITWLTQQLRLPSPTSKKVDSTAGMNKRCRNDNLKKLGYRFTYPDFRSGYIELIK